MRIETAVSLCEGKYKMRRTGFEKRAVKCATLDLRQVSAGQPDSSFHYKILNILLMLTISSGLVLITQL
jgi:hypothetical protein